VGVSYVQINRYEQAAETFERAAMFADRLSIEQEAWANKGAAHAEMEEWDTAIGAYREAIAIADEEDAERDPERASQGAPSSEHTATAETNLAYALWESGQTEQALEHAERAVERDPRFAEAWYNRGFSSSNEGWPRTPSRRSTTPSAWAFATPRSSARRPAPSRRSASTTAPRRSPRRQKRCANGPRRNWSSDRPWRSLTDATQRTRDGRRTPRLRLRPRRAGRDLREREDPLTVDEAFYDGEEADEQAVVDSLARCSVANLVGTDSVALAVEHGFVEEENVLDLEGTRHAMPLWM